MKMEVNILIEKGSYHRCKYGSKYVNKKRSYYGCKDGSKCMKQKRNI